MLQMLDPDPPCPSLKGGNYSPPKLTPKSEIFGGPEKGELEGLWETSLA